MDLYTLHDRVAPGTRVLVHAFHGFLDAGFAAQTAAAHMLATLESSVVATFDADALLDYRARRPRMVFDADHFESAEIPVLTVHQLRDAAGTPLLLMAGPEPDFRWQAFISCVMGLIDDWGIDLTVGLAGIPWPTPHTRPPGVTWHGSDRSLLGDSVPMVGQIEVPGHVGGLLELRLGQEGRKAMGLAAQVPHYLVQFDFPRSAISLLRALEQATGLVIPSDGLEASAQRVEAEVASQVSASEEFQEAVRALEQQYDALAAIQGADIASQVERFLATRSGDDDQRP